MARRGQAKGHYCWVCDRWRAHERFTGKGHRRHVCRDCAKLPAEELAFRQAVCDLERCVRRGGILKRHKKTFAAFLEHGDPRIRALAFAFLRESAPVYGDDELGDDWGWYDDEASAPMHAELESQGTCDEYEVECCYEQCESLSTVEEYEDEGAREEWAILCAVEDYEDECRRKECEILSAVEDYEDECRRKECEALRGSGSLLPEPGTGCEQGCDWSSLLDELDIAREP
ncbi:MAG: hypothetical protein RBU37_10105 [Myxococcota bacterium]|jgi:hypothetical protein|nr:hypothetical protein [Myxococcota bacterium]